MRQPAALMRSRLVETEPAGGRGCVPLGFVTPISPGNLKCQTTPVLVDSRRQLASALVELIDHAGQPLLAVEIARFEQLSHAAVVLVPENLEDPEISSAFETMLRKRINPEPVLFVPHLLLTGAEGEFTATSSAGRIASTYQQRGHTERF